MSNSLPEHQPIDPLLLSFPEQWTSERLLIRAPRLGDGATVNEAIVEMVLSIDDLIGKSINKVTRIFYNDAGF